MTEPTPTGRDRTWRHGGLLSGVVMILVLGGAVLSFVANPVLGIVIAAAGVVLGIVVALHPTNRSG